MSLFKRNDNNKIDLQAEAIRKILGQDSSKKKQEDKIKRQQEQMAQVTTEVIFTNLCVILRPILIIVVYIGAGEGCKHSSFFKFSEMGDWSIRNYRDIPL